MAYKLTNANIELFNKNYGVNVNLDKILAEAKRTSINDALISTFSEVYCQAVLRDLANSDKTALSPSMFENFSKLVIDSLIWESPINKDTSPDKYAGLNKRDQYDLMAEAWLQIPANNIDVVAESYKNGNIRIRDMVEFAKRAEIRGEFDRHSVYNMASYAEALKKVQGK